MGRLVPVDWVKAAEHVNTVFAANKIFLETMNGIHLEPTNRVDYDAKVGNVKKKKTEEGDADDSDTPQGRDKKTEARQWQKELEQYRAATIEGLEQEVKVGQAADKQAAAEHAADKVRTFDLIMEGPQNAAEQAIFDAAQTFLEPNEREMAKREHKSPDEVKELITQSKAFKDFIVVLQNLKERSILQHNQEAPPIVPHGDIKDAETVKGALVQLQEMAHNLKIFKSAFSAGEGFASALSDAEPKSFVQGLAAEPKEEKGFSLPPLPTKS
ncbi:MAG: hypothetical protein ACHP6I_01340 [Rickettsiales bacterium]